MDQLKTDVPNLRRICKSTANLQRLRTHLVGVIAHSGLYPMGKALFGYFDLFQWPHDSNLTMNIILFILGTLNTEIKGNFLPVGHTHEDIDALFGLFSKHLLLQDVYTFDGLCESFEDCTTKPRPRSTKPQKMFDTQLYYMIQPDDQRRVNFLKWSGLSQGAGFAP
ncbi:Hypothetical predicted protein [Paramuricea clavata]|uniref:DUF7869 domain-containing protein n=1 Tax=Paramuricea clavata TaxID=317549 RepID=A0A6S7LSN3_PARCT|nr:Hypothetical predicted protein [Paramuricea clavata]